jgi:hypothetical protein
MIPLDIDEYGVGAVVVVGLSGVGTMMGGVVGLVVSVCFNCCQMVPEVWKALNDDGWCSVRRVSWQVELGAKLKLVAEKRDSAD